MPAETTWEQLFMEASRRAKASRLKSRKDIITIINKLMPIQEPRSVLLSPKASGWDSRRQVKTSVQWAPGTMNMTLDFTCYPRAGALLRKLPAGDPNLQCRMTSFSREWAKHMAPVTLEGLFLGQWTGEWRFFPASQAVRRRYWNTPIRETLRELEREVAYPELFESMVAPAQFILDTFTELGEDSARAVQEAITFMVKANWAPAHVVCVDSEHLQQMVDVASLIPPRDNALEAAYPRESDLSALTTALESRLQPLVDCWPDLDDFFDVSDQNAKKELVRTVADQLVQKREHLTARATRIQDVYLAIVFHTDCPLSDDLEYVLFDTRQILRAAFGQIPAWFRPEASLCPDGCRSNEEFHQLLESARQFYYAHKGQLAVKPDLAVVVSRPSEERRTGGTWLHWDVGDECTAPLTGPMRPHSEYWQPCPDKEMTLP